ncbi:MAG: FkbM family methyltransferase [Haloarculaceae archaeon]
MASRVGGRRARFDVSTRTEYVRAADLGGEAHVLESLLDGLDGDEVVWDVGACVGTYACFLARALPDGHVVAFEPEPTNRRRLRRNLAANARPERWTVVADALSDTDGRATLSAEFEEAGAGHHRLVPAGGDGPQVTTRRGDSLAGVLPRPDVVKIDVQGAELQVLRSMGDALAAVDRVYVEVHRQAIERYGATPSAVESALRDAGFALSRLGEPTANRGGVYFLEAVAADE